ncbi:MAG: PadR family transcriptional regulator [Actinomycetota bacterium]|nr:PadR family transcriptional regulator [Actinomycetota bacterium]
MLDEQNRDEEFGPDEAEEWGPRRRHHHRHHGPGRGFGPGPRFRGGPGFAGDEEYQEPGDPDFAGPPFAGRGFGGPGGPWPGFGPGPRGFGPRGRGRGRGGRARRGDVRAAALTLVAEEPMHGYQIIQRIGERSGGIWRPSPGAVYPALAQLQDEGLISVQSPEGGRRVYALTDEGRDYVAAHAAELRAAWSVVAEQGAGAAAELRGLVQQVHLAAFGVLSAGTDAQVRQAREVLVQARRSLYRILAEDAAPGENDTAPGENGSAPGPDDAEPDGD